MHRYFEDADHRLVLVVDDDPTMRLIIRRTLELAEFEVVEAEDGRQALDAYRRSRGRFAAVLLDLVMPNLSGFETFREIRRFEPELPVLIVTGVAPEEAFAGIADRRHLSYLRKPVDPEVLLHQLADLIA